MAHVEESGSNDVPVSASGVLWSPGYRSYALILLMLIYTINFVDRQIVNILAEPIKHEFDLADWQIGLLGGLAFALFYVTLALPIARYAERGNRAMIISVSVAVWSVCTALCGFATSYTQLLLARIGVGVGEAGCSPAAHSLISESVPRERRAASLAFYQLGSPLGGLLGLAVGGLVASAFGWRAAFLIVGIPGIVFAVVTILTLRDPRKKAALSGVTASKQIPLSEAMAILRKKRSYWLVCFASGVKGIIGYGQGIFIASFFLRNHADALATLSAEYGLKPIGLVGIAVGLANGIGGLIGTYWGGIVTDRFARGSPAGYVTVPAIGSLVVIPFTAAMILAPSLAWALMFFLLQSLFAAVWPGAVYAVCQGVVPANMRATASAIQLFIGNLTGLCIGPLAVGLLSDFFSGPMGMGPAEGIAWSLFWTSLVGLLAFYLFWRARLYIAEDMEG
ncbi:MAG TPA: MFS transporter [Novosphingobium sp.]|nr:MFS transporter [Novosphingobium sp.]